MRAVSNLDKFVKHQLKARYYLRYADDFVLLTDNLTTLIGYLVEIARFLKSKLKLQLHPDKLILRKLAWGIDFVGYNVLPHYNLPRRRTVRRIMKQIILWVRMGDKGTLAKAIPSYLGYLGHANGYKISCRLEELMTHKG